MLLYNIPDVTVNEKKRVELASKCKLNGLYRFFKPVNTEIGKNILVLVLMYYITDSLIAGTSLTLNSAILLILCEAT